MAAGPPDIPAISDGRPRDAAQSRSIMFESLLLLFLGKEDSSFLKERSKELLFF
jgi:hypothetical protein